MKYGYFDRENKEYVITRPDTPTTWCNYLGSLEYGGIISNNAGGYSFVKSGAAGRIIRFRPNSVPMDQPGRYIYIRDVENGDYWSASWQPVGKDLKKYKSECRHGTGYTSISSEYSSIKAETLYFVPMNKKYEIWSFKIKNNSDRKRAVSIFGFVEFTCHDNYEQDSVNLQYTQFISKTYFKKGYILQAVNENCSEVGGESNGLSDRRGNGIYRFFGVSGQEVTAFEGDRDIFIGNYRNYSNPLTVENGKCTNIDSYNGNSCGTLQIDIELNPGEEKSMAFLLGAGGQKIAEEVLNDYDNGDRIENELSEVKKFWHSKLDRFKVETPDENFNNMVNVWNAYQCFITFYWSRAASFSYCGLRNGLGYRDTVQDIRGIIHLDNVLALSRLRLMISAQVSNGGGLPLVKFDHNPGHELSPEDAEYLKSTGHYGYRADDALWLFPTILNYINESGRSEFLDEIIPYSDKDEGSVFDHLRRAINFSMERMGTHGLPLGLHADWNDCLRLGSTGETTFVAFQLYLAIRLFIKFAEIKKDNEAVKWAQKLLEGLDENIQKHTWEEDQFIRAFTNDGYIVGSKNNEEANLWLNPQVWAVISGAAKEEQGRIALDKVYERLNTKYGAMIMYPPFKKYGLPVARMTLFNPSTKENAGVFSQTQGWLILAETMIGNGNRAFEYFLECSPASMNDRAEIRKIEPYVHGQFIESIDSPFEGRAHVHWLTGTASTVMVSMVEGVLGIQPEISGIRINPCIPSEWKGFSVYKEFRGKSLDISVDNSTGIQKGVKKIIMNNREYEGNFVPEADMEASNKLTVIMG